MLLGREVRQAFLDCPDLESATALLERRKLRRVLEAEVAGRDTGVMHVIEIAKVDALAVEVDLRSPEAIAWVPANATIAGMIPARQMRRVSQSCASHD